MLFLLHVCLNLELAGPSFFQRPTKGCALFHPWLCFVHGGCSRQVANAAWLYEHGGCPLLGPLVESSCRCCFWQQVATRTCWILPTWQVRTLLWVEILFLSQVAVWSLASLANQMGATSKGIHQRGREKAKWTKVSSLCGPMKHLSFSGANYLSQRAWSGRQAHAGILNMRKPPTTMNIFLLFLPSITRCVSFCGLSDNPTFAIGCKQLW